MKKVDLKEGTQSLVHCSIATHFFSRLIGLMGRREIAANEAIVFPRCNSIHTFFMRFPIDVVLVDSTGVVVEIIEAMSAWRFLAPRRKAKHVIEMKAHLSKSLGIHVGSHLRCEGVWN